MKKKSFFWLLMILSTFILLAGMGKKKVNSIYNKLNSGEYTLFSKIRPIVRLYIQRIKRSGGSIIKCYRTR